MKKQFLIYILSMACLQTSAQSTYTVDFDTYISLTDNDLMNNFMGTFGNRQADTFGLTGGCVEPYLDALLDDEPVYKKQFDFSSNAASVSICFKYDSLANIASFSELTASAGFEIHDYDGSFKDYIKIRVGSEHFGFDIRTTAAWFPMPDSTTDTLWHGHWYQLSLSSVNTHDDSTSNTVLLYDLGPYGGWAPRLVGRALNKKLLTNVPAGAACYVQPSFASGFCYLDNFKVTGNHIGTGIQELDVDNHFRLNTLVEDRLRVITDIKDEVHYLITGTYGSTLKKGSFRSNMEIGLNELPSSMYIIRFESNGRIGFKKFMKAVR